MVELLGSGYCMVVCQVMLSSYLPKRLIMISTLAMIYPLLNLFNIYLTMRSGYMRQVVSSQATLRTTHEFSQETCAWAKHHKFYVVAEPYHITQQTYYIRTNIGKELNLANWRIVTQSPSLNLANIFSIAYQLLP